MITTSNIKESASIRNAKNSVYKNIDAAVSLCDKVSDIEMNTNSLSNSGKGPFNFLIDLSASLGIYDKLLEFIEDLLIYELPIIETTAKSSLLNNIVGKISCLESPLIPSEFRLAPNNDYEQISGTNNQRGFMINIASIDYENILSLSPLSKEGSNFYFDNTVIDNNTGIIEYRSPYEFAKAQDTNCFLWYLMHYSEHMSPILLNNGLNDLTTKYGGEIVPYSYNGVQAESSPTFLSNAYGLTNTVDKTQDISFGPLIGTTFIRNPKSSIIEMCIKNEISKKVDNYTKRTWNATITKGSCDLHSTNYYVNLDSSLTGEKRNYNKDKAVLYCRYYDNITSLKTTPRIGKATYSNLQNTFQIAVLPEPFKIVRVFSKFKDILKNFNTLTGSEKIILDKNGVRDKHGKFSCLVKDDESHFIIDEANKNIYLELIHDGYFLEVSYYNAYYRIVDSNHNPLTDESILSEVLYECYSKSTIYDLFYDLIIGTKLYDSKTIAAELINSIANIRSKSSISVNDILNTASNISTGLSSSHSRIIEMVNETIKKELESEGSEYDDCFFNFSNDRFSELLESSEKKRKGFYSFIGAINEGKIIDNSNVIDILNEYSTDSTKEENKTVLHRAFTTTIENISNTLNNNEKAAITNSIIIQLLQGILNHLVLNLISPKVALLFEMEKQIMGDKTGSLNFNSFLMSIASLLSSTFQDLADLIINELYKLIAKEIKATITCMALKTEKEKADRYLSILKDLTDIWKKNSGKISYYGNDTDESVILNNTDDNTSDINNTIPIKENC